MLLFPCSLKSLGGAHHCLGMRNVHFQFPSVAQKRSLLKLSIILDLLLPVNEWFWQRDNARNVSFVISSWWILDSYQLLVFHFSADAVPQFLSKLTFHSFRFKSNYFSQFSKGRVECEVKVLTNWGSTDKKVLAAFIWRFFLFQRKAFSRHFARNFARCIKA